MKVSRGASLDRYYLLSWRGYGVFVHHIHHSDPAGVFHNHPWNAACFILGAYLEEYSDKTTRLRMLWNPLQAERFHRVEIFRPVYTLVFHGKRCNQWCVMDENTGTMSAEPWRGPGTGRDYTK